jgi:hypothetical protein
MISAQTPLAFVARENRYTLFRIMLERERRHGARDGVAAREILS